MKKIEAVIDQADLKALETHLAQAAIYAPAGFAQISIVEMPGRFYEFREVQQKRWKPCVKLDVIVSDSETQSAVNIILQHANLAGSAECGGNVDIVPLDMMREIGV